MRVRLTPKASKNYIDGLVPDAGGGMALKAGVTAPPEGGKANTALVRMLAKAWRLPKTSISVASGKGSRRNTLVIEGDTKSLLAAPGLDEKPSWLRPGSSAAPTFRLPPPPTPRH